MGYNILLGSHSTGKTSIIEEFKKRQESFERKFFVTEGISRVSYDIKKLLFLSEYQQQVMINELYLHLHKQYTGQDVLSTRSLLCTYLYSKYFVPDLNCEHLLNYFLSSYYNGHISNIYYISIEFDMVENEVRPDDYSRTLIDSQIQELLIKYSLPVTVLSGTVNERVNTLLLTIK